MCVSDVMSWEYDTMTSLHADNPVTITTPTEAPYPGLEFGASICGVSIVRAGESMEKALQQVA